MSELTELSLAVRVYPVPDGSHPREKSKRIKKWRRPRTMFVFDTETRTDAAQDLTFGSYRFFDDGRCLEEGIFLGDGLTAAERETIERYAKSHPADTDPQLGISSLRVLTRAEFLEKLYMAAYDGRALLIGFNLPFDLARIASAASPARGRFKGGFSFVISQYRDKHGVLRENRYKPRITVKHIDSKRALKRFAAANDPDPEDRIPDGSDSGASQPGYSFAGHFLDLRTFAFALTNGSFTLESACKAFGVEHGKMQAKQHGIVDSAYIDYNRRDVQATAELASKLLSEYDRHPIALQETKAYSPASIGKAYLRAMGILPVLERQPNFPKQILGYTQSAFYGGRTSAHIRKVAVPVVYCDFLSMYPTVNALMGLWNFVVAGKIFVRKVAPNEIQGFIDSLTLEQCFQPETWRAFAVYVRVIPDGDILPSRAAYNQSTNDLQVAVNYLHLNSINMNEGLWYALPDVLASKLLTGKTPKIVEAFRLVPKGQTRGLQSTNLRGLLQVDPSTGDFFRAVIEERKRPKNYVGLSSEEKNRQDQFLKVLANATSYGIFAQMDPRESSEPEYVTCFGIEPDPYRCRIAHPEEPGEYCFPPVASLITAAARLMLTLAERRVTDLGGTYAMEDTDSMAIVATEEGGLMPCAGGPYRTHDEREAVRALSWVQVDEIVARFKALSPYDASAIAGSVLKIEDDNFDPKTKEHREVWCLAISAKRYALFLRDENGDPELLRKGKNNDKDRWSEHGLGHLLNPVDPTAADRGWIGQAWLNMIRRSLGQSTKRLGFANRIAVGQVSVSSPAVLRPVQGLNAGKPYGEQIKPFNFILSCHVRVLGHPVGADPDHFHLIAPYEKDPRNWVKLPWVDQYSGQRYGILTTGPHGTPAAARIKTYGDVLREYEYHAESKCADAKGAPSDKQTIGLLSRRHVRVDGLRFIGKESNRLEEVEQGLPTLDDAPYVDYPDPRRDEWATVNLPKLKAIPLRTLRLTGLSRSTIQAIRAGRRPHRRNRDRLLGLLSDRGQSS
jgi:hypothetical protein